MAKRSLEIVLVGDSKSLDRAMKNADRSLGRLGSSAYKANRGMGGLIQQMGGSQRTALAANAAIEKQKQSLGELGRFAKRATLITGGLAAAGVAYGLKLNAQWETNEKSFGTLLGSMEKGKKLMEDLRQVSSKSYLRLTDFQEVSKGLIGVGVSAKRVVPLMKGVNAAIVAVGGDSEKLRRVTEALGQIKARGKVSARELQRLAQAGLPVNKILQREFKLTGEQVANIGHESVDADRALKAISDNWSRKYGPGLEESVKSGAAQMDLFKKNAEGFLRVATHGIYEALAKKALPAANAELAKFTDILNNERLSGSEKIDRLEKRFGRLIDRVGELGERAMPKVGAAIDRFAPMFGRLIEKVTPLVADMTARMISVMAPVIAKGAGTLAGAFVKGFINSDTWGRLLIGGWLFTKMGGFAAIRAAGTTAGTTVATSTAGGMAAGGSKVGAAAAGWKGSILASVRSAGIGVAVAGTIWAGIDAFRALRPVSGDLMSQLDQLEGKAGTVQAKMGGLLDKVKNAGGPAGLLSGISGAFGFDELGEAGKDADRLKVILGQINDVGGKRYGQLVAEGRQIAANLGLTKEARREVERALMEPGQLMSRGQAGIDNLASGMVTRFKDIRKLTADNAALIARAWGKNTPEWRSATARNMNAAIKAIKAGMRQGVIQTGKGWQRIREITRRRDLVTGSNVGGIAKGFRATWLNAGKISGQGIRGMIRDLKKMPPEAREQARQMMMRMARQLQSSGRLPKGSVSKLRSALVTEFGRAGDATKKTSDRIGQNLKRITDAQGKVVRSTQDFRRRFGTALTPLPDVTQTATGGVVSSFNSAKAAIQGGGAPQAKRRGGLIQRFARGGEVTPVRVSPGEAIVHRGKASIVPGKPEPRDSVFTYAPVGSTVLTYDGQQRMAAGASLAEARARQAPHFAGGGLVKKPVVTGSTVRGRETANLAIGKVYSAAQSRLKKLRELAAASLAGNGISGLLPRVKAALAFAKANGWGGSVTSGFRTYAQQAALYEKYLNGTGNLAAPPGTSNHEGGQAVDVSDTEGFARTMDMMGPNKRLYRRISGEPWHFSITGYAKGGKATPASMRKKARSRIRAPWLKRYKRFTKDQLYTLAAYAGIGDPAWASQVAWGESSYNPRTVGHDPGGTQGLGLWQITTGYNDALIARLGGRNAMFDPLTNAVAAAAIYRAQGKGAWYGRLGPAGKFDPDFYNEIMYSPAQRKHARKASRKRLGGVKGLWRSIGKHGGSKAAKKRARFAGRNARKAIKLAQSGDLAGSLAARNRSLRFQKKASKGVGSGKPSTPARTPVRTPARTPARTGALFKGLPEPIRKMLEPMISTPNLGWQKKRDILENALGVAEGTDGIDDDRKVYGLIIKAEQARRRSARKMLRRSNRGLVGFSAAGIAGRVKRNREIDRQLRKLKPEQKERRKRLLAEQKRNNRRIGAYERLTGRRDRALDTINDADAAIRDARASRRDLTGEGATDSGEDLKAILDELRKMNDELKRGTAMDERTLTRAMADLMSGMLAGRADVPTRLGFSPAVNF